MNTRRVTLIVAVVLALAAAVLTIRFLSAFNQQQTAAPVSPPKDVLVASVDIPARAKITPDMLVKTTRPTDVAGPTSVSDPKQLEGDIAMIAIRKDQIINSDIVGHPPVDLLTTTLKPGLRAITIPVDKVKEIAGLIAPGDRVDVIAVPPKVGNRPPTASTIIRGALVLALNNSTDTAGATPSPDNAGAATVTLGVTPKQANLITMADLNTTLRLALRSPQEPVRSLPPDDLVFDEAAAASAPPAVVFQSGPAQPNAAQDLLRAALAAQAKSNAPPVAVPPASPQEPAVEVIDGSSVVSGSGAK